MNRSLFFAATLLSAAAPIHAIPPPAPPPLSPEVTAAAEALIAALPFEEALARTSYFRSDGIMAHRVTDRLMSDFARHRRLGCNREYVRTYLVPDVARLLPERMPEVLRRLRASLAANIGYSASLEDLISGRALLETASGRALVLNSWGPEFPMGETVALMLAMSLVDELDSLLGKAVSDCRRLGRPPPPPM